jgi:hypothetical protein
MPSTGPERDGRNKPVEPVVLAAGASTQLAGSSDDGLSWTPTADILRYLVHDLFTQGALLAEFTTQCCLFSSENYYENFCVRALSEKRELIIRRFNSLRIAEADGLS